MSSWRTIIAVGLLEFAAFGQSSNVANNQTGQSLRPTVTNTDVLEMQSAGFSDEVIIAKIEASHSDFDTTPGTLARLKMAGISERIILAMIGHGANPADAGQGPTSIANTRSQGKATIHFYRESNHEGGVYSLRSMPIYVDETQVADLGNGRYFSITVEPGKHFLRSSTKPEAIEVEIEPGQEYYLRAELRQTVGKNHWRVSQVTREQGQADAQGLKPLDVKNIAPLARQAPSR